MVTGEAAWEGYGRAPPAAGRRSWGGVWCGRNPRERMRKGKRESEEGFGVDGMGRPNWAETLAI